MALKKNPFLLGLPLLVAFALLYVGIFSYKHLLLQSKPELITLDHQLRRMLSHAERETIKSAVTSDEEASPPATPQEFCAIFPPTHLVAPCSQCFHTPQSLMEQKSFAFDSSPVLNL
jgi:hypothetical protein